MAKYFTRYSKDSLALKGLVGGLFVTNLGEVVSAYAYVYLYSVVHWGKLSLSFIIKGHILKSVYI